MFINHIEQWENSTVFPVVSLIIIIHKYMDCFRIIGVIDVASVERLYTWRFQFGQQSAIDSILANE